MKVTTLRWLLLPVLVLWIVVLNAFPSEPMTLGVSLVFSDGAYRYAGGTDPAALGVAALLLIGYWALLNGTTQEGTSPMGGVFRRFVAFWIDFMFSMFTVAPVLGILPAVVEWRRTGSFEWTFERTTPARGDALQAWGILAALCASLVLYHVLPLLRHRPSPGACIMGYRVIPDEGTILTFKTAVLRTAAGFVAACAAYLAPFIGRDRKKGKFWLDKVFGTRAVKLS